MNRGEKETQVLANNADGAAGYFVFQTSSSRHYKRMLRRIGGQQNLKALRTEKNSKGTIVFWSCEVPIKFWSRNHFGVKSNRKMEAARRKPSIFKKSQLLSIEKDDNAQLTKNQSTVRTLSRESRTLSQIKGITSVDEVKEIKDQ